MPLLLMIAIPVAVMVILSTIFLYFLEKDILIRLGEVDPQKKKEILSVTGRAHPRRLSRFLKNPGTDDKYLLSRIRLYRIMTIISAVPVFLLILLIILLFV